jgi:hypothetical protein
LGILDQFTEEQRAFLIALPYRTGLWISQCDMTGGEEADLREREALEIIVTAFSEDFCKSEFVEELMRQTVVQAESWERWQDGINDVPTECRRAIDMLAPVLERKDISSLKVTLLEIASTVAEAYREEEEEVPGLMPRLLSEMRFVMDRFSANMAGRPAAAKDRFMNISAAEKAALAALTAALLPGKAEGLPPQDADSAVA